MIQGTFISRLRELLFFLKESQQVSYMKDNSNTALVPHWLKIKLDHQMEDRETNGALFWEYKFKSSSC